MTGKRDIHQLLSVNKTEEYQSSLGAYTLNYVMEKNIMANKSLGY